MVLGVLDQFIIGLGGDLGFICKFFKTNFGTPNRLLHTYISVPLKGCSLACMVHPYTICHTNDGIAHLYSCSCSNWKLIPASCSKWQQIPANCSKWQQIPASCSKWQQILVSCSNWAAINHCILEQISPSKISMSDVGC